MGLDARTRGDLSCRPSLALSPHRAVLGEPRAGRDLWPGVNPACANASSLMLTCLNPPFALQTEAAAPGVLTAASTLPASPGRHPLAGTPATPSVPRRLPAGTGVPGGIRCGCSAVAVVGTHRYSRENLVSSRLL